MAPLVWVTGSGGLIGSHLVRTAAEFAGSWRVAALTRQQVDLLDFDSVQRSFERESPQAVIHCAGLTQSAACQANPNLAWRLNVQATEHLARLSAAIPFVFFSTDLVFDGKSGGYTESSLRNPLNVYGETKAAAEDLVLGNPKHLVIRTSLNAGTSPTGDRGFDEQLLNAWKRGETPRLFTDEFRSPIAAAVTARAVWEILLQGLSGLFHLAGSERISRWEIGQLLMVRHPELHPKAVATSCKEYTGPPRAPDTSMDCSKVQACLSFQLPRYSEYLAKKPVR